MSQCLTPFFKKDTGMSFPCGSCVYCRARRASSWSFRLQNHIRKNPLASFVTLTYNTDHVPITKAGRMSLDKTDITKFIKRLRIIQERQQQKFFSKNYITKYYGKKITYYAAGEYGTRYSRPHYHLILHNAAPENVIKAWVSPQTGKPIGTIFFGTVTPASIGYTLKYISKESKVPQYKGDDRISEFQRMSKGIGLDYITPGIVRWHLSDLFDRCYGQLPHSDIKVALPRYYKDRIYTALERQMIGEALQSKNLETTHWGSYPQYVNNLIHIDPKNYYSLQYQKFQFDTERNRLKINQNDMF